MKKSWTYKYTIQELRAKWKQELLINRNRLEMASLEQATLFEKWYAAAEELEGDLRDLNRELIELKSTMNLRVRRVHPDYKEGAITAAIEKRKDVSKLNRKINDTKRRHGALQGAVKSAQMRKSMIQTLKDLYISNYWDKSTSKGTPIHGRRHKRTPR